MIRQWVLSAIALLICGGGWVGAAEKRVEVVAYINLKYGCQKATEEFLTALAGRYGERMKLEFVDFGGKGKKRWREDGMHCMAIRINGTTAVEITDRAVQVPVRFVMPAGYHWMHADLEIAIRQAIEGVAAADRLPPAVSVVESEGVWGIKVGGEVAVSGLSRKRADAAVAALVAASSTGLTQDVFTAREQDGAVELLVAGKTFLMVDDSDGQKAGKPVKQVAGERLVQVARHYPCLTRPFPGSSRPGRR